MARTKAEQPDEAGEFSPASLVRSIKQDKALTDVVNLGSGSLRSDIPYFISTRLATVDYAIGAPGIPASRVSTIFGREGSGKSTLGQLLLAEVQRMGGLGILIDSEQRLSKERAKYIGLNLDDLLVVDGATMEQSFEAIEKILDQARVHSWDMPICVVYDSLAGSVPKKRLEADVDGVMVGAAAKLVGAELPRLKLKVSKLGVALVIVNQIRSRIQDFSDPRSRGYAERNKVMGQKEAMLAEWPLLFESSLMLRVNSTAALGTDPQHPEGIRSRVVVRKCGISPHEGWRGEFEIGKYGPNIEQSKWEMLEELGVIEHSSGGWYKYRTDGVGDFADKKIKRSDFGRLLTEIPALDVMISEAPTLWRKGMDVRPNHDELTEEMDAVVHGD